MGKPISGIEQVSMTVTTRHMKGSSTLLEPSFMWHVVIVLLVTITELRCSLPRWMRRDYLWLVGPCRA